MADSMEWTAPVVGYELAPPILSSDPCYLVGWCVVSSRSTPLGRVSSMRRWIGP